MRMYKVMFIAILSVILILSGCEKDEVVPITEKTKTNIEQTTSEVQVEQKEETASKEEQVEQSKQEQQDNVESTSTTNDSKDDSNTVVTTKDEAKEPTKESTAQKTTTESSTDHTNATEKEVKVTNKTSTTTQKTQTTPEKKTITNDQSAKQTETEKVQTATPPPKKEAPKQTVTISIVGDQQKGTILSSTKIEMVEGNTVLDITTKILKQKGIPISVTGSGSGAYVEGIANLFEFDHGPLSGWTIKRNGAKLDRSSGAVQVKSGDSIQWIYTSDYEAEGK